MTTTVEKPVPHPSPMTQPYWDGARAGKLLFQQCSSCGKTRHYPQLLCKVCYSADVNWVEGSGSGAVHSWTVAHHAFHPGFAADLPYTLLIVDMAEGVRVMGRYVGAATLVLGLPVQMTFVNDAQCTPVPTFTSV